MLNLPRIFSSKISNSMQNFTGIVCPIFFNEFYLYTKIFKQFECLALFFLREFQGFFPMGIDNNDLHCSITRDVN